MKTQWTKGLTGDAADDVVKHFKGSVQLRMRLSTILEEKVRAKDKELMNKGDYELANWAYKQADGQGYKRAMTEILSLL